MPEGIRRLWIATSVVWLIAYLLLNWDGLTLLWQGALSTPQTTCAQVYSNVERRSYCESIAAGGREPIQAYLERKQKGGSLPFDPYFEKYRDDEKVFIWLGAPIAWLVVLWLAVWVRRGFKE
jgi:hypothetical protein